MKTSRFLLAGLLLGILWLSPPAAFSQEAKGEHVVGKRLGMLPDMSGKPKLKLHWKANTPPASPPKVDHFTGWTFNMGGNNQYGSCGPTSAANHLGMSRKFLLGIDKPVPLDQVLDLYRRSTNPPFDPRTGANDNGVVMSDLLAAMADGGLDGDKVVAYASFADISDPSIYAAINEFGGVLFAVNLQTAQQAQTDAGYWDYKRSGAWGGHAILSGKYDKGTGRVDVVTWKQDVYTTAAFRKYQLTEVWLPIWKSSLDSGKFYATGVDINQLAADWKALTGNDFPVPVPPAPPTPPPPTPPTPPAPGKLPSYTETTVVKDGIIIKHDKVDAGGGGILPDPVPGKEYTIDLSSLKNRPLIQEHVKNKIMRRVRAEATVEEFDVSITDNGDSITIAPKAKAGADGKVGFDWNAFADFIMKILPLILQIFSAFASVLPDPTTWYAAAGCCWHLVA